MRRAMHQVKLQRISAMVSSLNVVSLKKCISFLPIVQFLDKLEIRLTPQTYYDKHAQVQRCLLAGLVRNLLHHLQKLKETISWFLSYIMHNCVSLGMKVLESRSLPELPKFSCSLATVETIQIKVCANHAWANSAWHSCNVIKTSLNSKPFKGLYWI